MKKTLFLIAALCSVLGSIALAYRADSKMPAKFLHRQQHREMEPQKPPSNGSNRYTLAVFGDWPYSPALLNAAPTLVNSINSDPQVKLVMHLGDIHSGSMPCTGAGLNPIPPGADPNWNQGIYNIFQQFQDPVVYTPGDNEWTDCHRAKSLSSGAPLKELDAIRQLFFARPGVTLGQKPIEVDSQAFASRRLTKAVKNAKNARMGKSNRDEKDAQYVENVRWKAAQVVFVTLNVPGSNNDTIPWEGVFADPTAQNREVADRTAADIRWLKGTFEAARRENAKGVVIGLQADMWDLTAPISELTAYQSIVEALANECIKFGKPVLLLNGDSHLYGTDKPLADPNSSTGKIFHTRPVPNLTRITVQGSTNKPSEWLRLTIDPRSQQLFSWDNVVYLP